MIRSLNRRSFFARFRGGPAQLRPPWSKPEQYFVDACTQCGECIAACPTGLITRGHARYPIVDFTNANCTFCGACAEACKAGCYDRSRTSAWMLNAITSAACVEAKGVSCRICGEVCDARAIQFQPRTGGGSNITINEDVCTGCGACVAACPVAAISIVMHELDAEVST